MFSDYIVYADESGSPVLDGIDPNFPIFVLSKVLVAKEIYRSQIVPAIQKLKFDFTGHDQLILHERDIRRQSAGFAFLQTGKDVRTRFLEAVNALVASADMQVVATVIDKEQLKVRYAEPWSPYDVALYLCLERTLEFLLSRNQQGCLLHVVFESRGAREDAELELRFRRITANEGHWGHRRLDFSTIRWEPVFADKRSNSAGLQLADLVARPIGLKALRPLQTNQAFDIIRSKLLHGSFKSFP
ncbi:MAG: DUF3800 domain-containing protein [Caulobacteraceae bacterium]|nr:DUF3800 domain-containing protein [Caulobacteraceae bacterium]